MSLVLFLNQPQESVGLPTYTFTIPAASAAYPFGGAGEYTVKVQLNVTNSLIGAGAGSDVGYTYPAPVSSGVSYVVNQNGSPVYTSPPITPAQIALQSATTILCAVSDVITVVFSSSQAIDAQLNTVKEIVSINQGLN